MVTRKTNKDEFAASLHNFVMQHNKDIGIRAGMPEDQVDAILADQEKASKVLCEHIYDFLVVEGYIERG
jgi:hypothetical protein